ncbi:MAG TPA: 2-amino-4-hydroxy-6-hydroxymethyldihydropteridine diphosphokinase [Stellaceae bacterium]|nr:2-amino-4-hydroxy-6-hydroxymethyldihydropteridine diphosphokinase [Stellaceae bacterium]
MILIGLGSNLESARFGPPRKIVAAACRALEGEGVRICARSSWYRSEPVPRSDQPWYVNGVAALASNLGAGALLALLQQIETRFGRVRQARNAARVLDLDLLDHDGEVVATPVLTLPHPRLGERRFVLVPLLEIAPSWRHPLSGLSAGALLLRIPAEAQPLYRLPDDCNGAAGPL